MANGADIAKAYVQIIPSAEGIQGKLTEVMDGEADKAGNSAGSKFSGALGKVLKTGGAIVGAFTGATTALGGALVKGAGDVAAYGDNIDKMSQKLGLSATAYQQWDYVLGQAGADINSMSTGMKTLTNKLDDAKNGSESARQMFAALGLSMEDLSSMSREDVFESVIYGFQGMADSTERAALANDLFGKSGQELTPLFNSSVEDTKALIAASSELGFVMSDEAVKASADYSDALDTLKRTMGGVKNSALGDLLPGITQVMDGLTEMFTGGDGLPQISEGINSIVDNISAALPQFIELGGQIVLSLSEAVLANLPTLVTSFVGLVGQLTEGLLTPDNIALLVDASIQITLALVDGLIGALPILIDGAVTLATTLATKLSDPDTIGKMIKAAWEIIKALASGIIKAIPQILTAAGQVLSNLFTALGQGLGKLGEIGRSLLQSVVTGIRGAISSVVSIGRNIVEGIWNGISNALGWIKSKITGWVGNVMSFIKNLFGIHSPSTFGVSVGENVGGAVGIGFVNSMETVRGIMKKSVLDLGDLAQREIQLRPAASVAYGTRGTAAFAPQYSYGGVTIQILGRGKDAEQLAVEMQDILERRSAPWA